MSPREFLRRSRSGKTRTRKSVLGNCGDAGIYTTLIQSGPVLQNEFSFDRLFCDVIVESNFSIYYNAHFSDDPIFNHAAISSSILDSDEYSSIEIAAILDSIVTKTDSVRVPASIYVERFWKNARRFEGDSIDYGFRIIEQMEVLTKGVERPPEEDTDIELSGLKTSIPGTGPLSSHLEFLPAGFPNLKGERECFLMMNLQF